MAHISLHLGLPLKGCGERAGETTQGFRALVLAEDPGLIPSTHRDAHNRLPLQFQRILSPLLVSSGTRIAHDAQTYGQAKHLFT